jgi:hypothetical protein
MADDQEGLTPASESEGDYAYLSALQKWATPATDKETEDLDNALAARDAEFGISQLKAAALEGVEEMMRLYPDEEERRLIRIEFFRRLQALPPGLVDGLALPLQGDGSDIAAQIANSEVERRYFAAYFRTLKADNDYGDAVVQGASRVAIEHGFIVSLWSPPRRQAFKVGERIEPPSILDVRRPFYYYRIHKNAPTAVKKLLGFVDPTLNILVVATHGVAAHMNRHLLARAPETSEKINLRQDGKLHEVVANSTLALPKGVSLAHTPESVLKQMQERILGTKNTSLLKLHLDLMDQAHRSHGEPFWLYLADSLDRLRYTRQAHGSFHAATMRDHFERLVVLATQRIEVFHVKGRGKDDGRYTAPYWELKLIQESEPGDDLGPFRVLLSDPTAPIYRRVLVAPGMWWQAIQMPQYHFHVPRALLALETDGKGNEVNKIALQVAAELAVWERTNLKHGVGTMTRRLGDLLEHASVATFSELAADLAKKGKAAKRLREYLVGADGMGGAFKILRELGAFEIDVEDEEAFWASGYGWLDKFWGSELRIEIRAVDGLTPADKDGKYLPRGFKKRRKSKRVNTH